MLSKQIFITAFGMIFTNFTTTLRTTLPIFLGGVLIAQMLAMIVSGDANILLYPKLETTQNTDVFQILFFALLIGLIFTAMIVQWHRHNLLPLTHPRRHLLAFPPLSAVKDYCLALLRLLLLLVPFFLAAGVVIILLLITVNAVAPVSPLVGVLFNIVFSFVATILATAFVLRWSLILPAAAIGAPLTLRGSRTISAPLSRTILILATAQLVLFVLLEFISAQVAELIPGLATFIGLMLLWFEMLFSASVLTALYAHLARVADETPKIPEPAVIGPYQNLRR